MKIPNLSDVQAAIAANLPQVGTVADMQKIPAAMWQSYYDGAVSQAINGLVMPDGTVVVAKAADQTALTLAAVMGALTALQTAYNAQGTPYISTASMLAARAAMTDTAKLTAIVAQVKLPTPWLTYGLIAAGLYLAWQKFGKRGRK